MPEPRQDETPPADAPIERTARRARRLIYAAAAGLFAVALLGIGLGIDTWPNSSISLRQALAESLSGGDPLLVAVPAVAFAGVALFLRRSRRIASGEATRPSHGHIWIALLAVLYALGMTLAGWQQVTSMRLDFQQERMGQQVAIARLKARQIDDWAQERRMNLRFLGSSLKTMPLEDIETTPQIRQLVELTLAQFLSSNPERIAAGLFQPDGTPLVTAGLFDPAHAGDLARQVRDAAGGRGIVVGPVRGGGASSTGLSVPFLDPIDVAIPGKPNGRLVVVSVIDPTLGVLKGFADWPTPSRTSELELIYREGDEIVHVVTGKKPGEGPALSLRNSVMNSQLLGARAVTTNHAVWDAVDHHGNRVLAATYHTTAFPWIVVAKTDFHEAMQPVEGETRKIWAMIVALVLFGGLFALALEAQLTMAEALRR